MTCSELAPDFHDHKAGQAVELHAHDEGQVLVAVEGSMDVWFGDRQLQLAPRTALWVPPGLHHAARSREHTAFRGVMVEAAYAAAMPRRVARFATSPLFVAATLDLAHARASRRARATRILFDVLDADLGPQAAPGLPRDPRFIELCRSTLAEPADAPSLDEAARRVRMSRRSFTRGFRAATGLGWTEWVRDARLSQAAALLAEGASVTDAAMAVGYATPSAFSFAFRRDVGTAPVRLRS